MYPNYQQSGCLQCFADIGVSHDAATPTKPATPTTGIAKGLEVPVHKETLHSGVRQYLHRMIICLGDELLKCVPMVITLLLLL